MTTTMPTKPPFAGFARKPRAEVQREYADRRPDSPSLQAAAKIRSSPAWQRLRAHFLAVHPICGICGQALAQHAHHIKPVECHPDLALVWGNLAPVCTRCHSACNGRERAGIETATLFPAFERRSQFGGIA